MAMELSVSEMQDWISCPQLWFWKWVLNRAVRRPGPALRAGLAVHACFEERLRSGDRPGIDADFAEAEPNLARVLTAALGAWDRKYLDSEPPWTEIIAVEEPLRLQLTEELALVGRPDSIVRWQSGIWHVQHKTTGQSTPVATFAAGIRRSFHENLYGVLIENAYPNERYMGTMLNVVRKLSMKRVDEDPNQALHMEFLPIPKAQRLQAVESFRFYGKQIKSWRDELSGVNLRIIPQNREHCTGQYKNTLCSHFGPCENPEAIWQDEHYETYDPRSRYQAKPSKPSNGRSESSPG